MAAASSISHLLYLHGFRSSPRSFKAQRVQAWLAEHRPEVNFWCPQLPPSPREAMQLVFDGIRSWPVQHAAVMGSSLGGYYASVVANATGWPCVVMNPAVDPARDLAGYVGELQAYHDPSETFVFEAAFIDELRAMNPWPLEHPAKCLALIAKADELLDWREMSQRYRGATLALIDGSDHALSDFDDHLAQVMRFLGLQAD